MPFTSADVTFTVAFSIAGDQKSGTITITDTSNFALYGIALSDVSASVTVISPDGTQFKTANLASPDIADESVTRAISVNLPLDANGLVQQGGSTAPYKVQLYVRVAGITDPGDYNSALNSFVFCPTVPQIDVTFTSNCYCTPIMSAALTTDTTGWTINSQSITLNPPANAVAPLNTPYTSATSTVNSGGDNAYAGRWTVTATQVLTRTEETHTETITLVMNSSVAGNYFDLTCQSMCEVLCCLEAQALRVENARGTGSYNSELAILTKMIAYVVMIQAAEKCGEGDKIAEYSQIILDTGNCTSACGDCQDKATSGLITPLCSESAGTTYLAGTGISISGGNVISLGATEIAILAGTYNTVPTSSDSSVTITGPVITAGTPPVHTYDFTIPPALRPLDSMSFFIDIDLTVNPVTFSLSTPVIKGTVFSAGGMVVSGRSGLAHANPAGIRVRDFYTDGTLQGDHALVMEIVDMEWGNPASDHLMPALLKAHTRVSDTGTPLHYEDYVFLREYPYSPSGFIESWFFLSTYLNSIKVKVNVVEL